jgi:hypothetical protein
MKIQRQRIEMNPPVVDDKVASEGSVKHHNGNSDKKRNE